MYTSVNGVYRNGKVELEEHPDHVPEETRVLVTFVTPEGIGLESQGIRREQAADLRARLSAFAEDWESPEMSLYDDYDAAHPRP
jgi:hypothetical protein